MKKSVYFRFLQRWSLILILLTGVIRQEASAINAYVQEVTSSSCLISWSPVAGATEYWIMIYGINTSAGNWGSIPNYAPAKVKSPQTQLLATNIGFMEPFWDDDRKIIVEARSNGTLLEKTEVDIALLYPGPALTGITNVTSSSFTVSWNKTVPNVANWSDVSLYITNDETGEWFAFKELTTSSQAVTGLASGTKYLVALRGHQRVWAAWKGEYLDIWSDITKGEIYTKIVAPVALQALNIQPNAFLAQWNKTPGANTYRFFLKEKVSGKIIINGESTTVLSKWVQSLESGLEYEYQVTAVNDQEESARSNSIRATTEMLERPVAIQPTNVTDHSFTARWNPVPGATKYRLEIYVDQNWIWRFTTATSFNFTEFKLKPNTNYVYRVRAIFSTELSYFGNEISLMTRVAPPVALPATNITATSFTARWEAVVGATGYKLWIISSSSTGSNPPGYFPKSVGNVVSHAVTGLLTGHEYTYFVQAIGVNGESVASPAIYVTTSGSTTFTITLSSSPANAGTLTGAGSYTQGKAVTVTATAGSGYAFVNWTEGTKVASTSASYTFTVNASRTLVANFTNLPVNCDVTLVASPDAGGTVSGGGSFVVGSSVTVKASTSKGYEFVNWTDGSRVVSTSQAYTFTVNAATTLVANFRIVPQQYTVSLSSSPVAGGTVTGGGSFTEGSDVNVRATPGRGYEFVSWTEGTRVVSMLPGYTFTLNGNKTLVANFKVEASQSTLTLSSSPLFGGGTLGAGRFTPGTTVTISAVPEDDYEFVNWTEGNTVVTTSVNYKFTLNGDRSLVANFREKAVTNTLTLSATPAAGGTVSGGGTFTQGSSVTVTATPAKGYEFVNWTEGTKVASTSASYTFTLSANRTLTANFRQATVTTYTVALSAAPAAGGSVSGGGTFNVGTTVTAHAQPAVGYVFVNWTEGTTVVSTLASYVFTLSAPRNLTANFTVNTPVGDFSGSQLRVWPNPVTSELHISGVTARGVLKLTDISGRMVYMTSWSSPEPVVPMGSLQPGIYLLVLETADSREVHKIVKR